MSNNIDTDNIDNTSIDNNTDTNTDTNTDNTTDNTDNKNIDNTDNKNSDNKNLEAKKKEFVKNSFDREFLAFIKQAQETINARYGVSIEFGDIRKELVCLNKYLNIYNNMEPEEHYIYFRKLYNKNRSSILNILNNDKWLAEGEIYIQFGDGIKSSREVAEKRKQVRIYVSEIYSIALDLQKKAEKTLDGLDETIASEVGGKDLIRPQILQLHLWRIFYHLSDDDDRIQLGKIVTQLENILGVPKKTVNDDMFKSMSQNMSSNTSGLSGLFNMATSMMEKMGYKAPPGMTAPSEREINDVISNVFGNDTTQSAIKNMFTSLQGCNDFGSAMQEVVKNVTDPKTMEAIHGSVMNHKEITPESFLPPKKDDIN
jgi:hypothetical protein